MKKVKVTTGVYWVEVPDADLRLLCGAPADVVKHLIRGGFISTTEKNGVPCETGPNAILLSDVNIQNGEFSNLTEFPVLQMLYRQGFIIPGHPNNTGKKPLIIGTKDQVLAQREYIYRGNYGLVNKEEIMATGVAEERAEELMRIKRAFAFGIIKPPEELIDFHIIGDEPIEVVPSVYVERVAVNTYRISHGGDYVEVGLNLERHESYEPPYFLGQQKIKRDYFSVVHTGEGDGWDIHRPCMASILVFQGRVYLIDAGPNVMHTLTSLGISVNEIEGIFHTHAHDDHFSGLTSLVLADHKLTHYATPLVRASIAKKLSALMSFPEEQFTEYFQIFDLVEGEWNMIDGLEVRPVFSPHPVETTIMFFRALWDNDYKTYAHFADISSFEVLKRIMENDSEYTRNLHREVEKNYLTRVDVKKLDIGGGMIHGVAQDFRNDLSGRIVMSHKATDLTIEEKEIGSNTSFGMRDILIRTDETVFATKAVEQLHRNFPGIPDHELNMLANCPTSTRSVGSIIVKKEEINPEVFLLVNGLVEVLNADESIQNIMTAGAFIGERSSLRSEPSDRTYRSASFVYLLEIPSAMYLSFIERNGMLGLMEQHLEQKHYLEGSYILGDRISGNILTRIAQSVTEVFLEPGTLLDDPEHLFFVARGRIVVECDGKMVESIGPRSAVGEQAVLDGCDCSIFYRAEEKTKLYAVPVGEIKDIPIARWKLLEMMNRRIRACNAFFQKA